MIATNVTNMLQSLATTLRPYLVPAAKPTYTWAPAGMRTMWNNSLVDLLNYAFDDLIGYQGINWLLNHFTYYTGNFGNSDLDDLLSTVLSEPFSLTDVAKFSIPIAAMNATLGLNLDAFMLSGLNTWTILQMLDPVTRDNYTLDSHTQLMDLGYF